MSTRPNSKRSFSSTAWSLILVAAAILVLVFILASVNLIRTAVDSQPECVAHEKPGLGNDLALTAAKSAC